MKKQVFLPQQQSTILEKVDGVVLLNKAKGISSQQAVTRLKHLLRAKKAGHTGTLDPLASGLLVVALGEATKFCHFLLADSKSYNAVITLGQSTASGDAEGAIVEEMPLDIAPPQNTIEMVLKKFVGVIKQTPPIYSALKHQGKPLYHYARLGIEVPVKAREVEIYSLNMESYDPALPWPRFTVSISCSSGTYIRSLAIELGLALGVPAHLSDLVRTRVGNLSLADAYSLEEIAAAQGAGNPAFLQPPDLWLEHLPRYDLSPSEWADIQLGRSLPYPVTAPLLRFYFEDRCRGIGSAANGWLQPQRLLLL